VTGIWGITFLIAWTVSTAHWMWKAHFEWKVIRPGSVVYVFVMAAVLFCGQIRLAWFQPNSKTIRIGTVAASAEDIAWITSGEKSPPDATVYSRRILDHYLERTRILAQGGARLVIWDELAIRASSREEGNSSVESGKALARREGIYLLMGLGVDIPPDSSTGNLTKPRENKAVLIGPDGSTLLEYIKGNPTPGSRDVDGGDEAGLAETPLGMLAAAICYDTVNPEYFRTMGFSRADLLMVPTYDNPAIEYLHMEMSRMRAVENGSALVLSTREGYSAAFDALGRLLALSGRNTPDRTMIADVPVESVRTLYPIIGDLFGWLCVIGVLGLAIVSLIKRQDTRP
jgi:apolipoprotein N-acyltransferase